LKAPSFINISRNIFFFSKAANSLAEVCPVLGASLALQAKQIGLKAQIKIHREVKRRLCKVRYPINKFSVTVRQKLKGYGTVSLKKSRF
jgi:RNase P subunit RPR2